MKRRGGEDVGPRRRNLAWLGDLRRAKGWRRGLRRWGGRRRGRECRDRRRCRHGLGLADFASLFWRKQLLKGTEVPLEGGKAVNNLVQGKIAQLIRQFLDANKGGNGENRRDDDQDAREDGK